MATYMFTEAKISFLYTRTEKKINQNSNLPSFSSDSAKFDLGESAHRK